MVFYAFTFQGKLSRRQHSKANLTDTFISVTLLSQKAAHWFMTTCCLEEAFLKSWGLRPKETFQSPALTNHMLQAVTCSLGTLSLFWLEGELPEVDPMGQGIPPSFQIAACSYWFQLRLLDQDCFGIWCFFYIVQLKNSSQVTGNPLGILVNDPLFNDKRLIGSLCYSCPGLCVHAVQYSGSGGTSYLQGGTLQGYILGYYSTRCHLERVSSLTSSLRFHLWVSNITDFSIFLSSWE